MIAVDTNILVYAHRRDSQFHQPAEDALRRLAEGRAAWAIPWPCVHEFLAVVTHPAIYSPPSPPDAAIAQVEAWLAAPTAHTLGEGPDYWSSVRGALRAGEVTGPRVHDARVAAICEAAGVHELWSADRDFSRFRIRTRNPLA